MSVLRGQLLPDLPVDLHPDTARLGGAWVNDSPLLRAYDPVLLEIVNRHCLANPRAVLWDIGASTGSFSLLAVWHPGIHVVAFEPNPQARTVLLENVRLNGLEGRVTVRGEAVSAWEGMGYLWSPPMGMNTGMGQCSPPVVDHNHIAHPVQFVRLDDLSLPAPSLVKLDIEGMEYFALSGAEKTIRACRPVIVSECCGLLKTFGHSQADLQGLVESWGARWTEPVDGNIHVIWPRAPELVSIVLPSMNRPDRLERCVKSILDNTRYPHYEVLVVIDVCTESRDRIQMFDDPRVRVFFNAERQGAIACWNQGLRHARGDRFAFFNDDCEPEPGWLIEALAAHEMHLNGYGVVGFNDGYQDGNVLAVQYLFDRKFCKDHLGGVMAYPVYEFAFNDTETNDRAKRAGRFYWCESAVVQHRHWGRVGGRDALNDENMDRQGRDGYVYDARKAAGFPDDFEAVI